MQNQIKICIMGVGILGDKMSNVKYKIDMKQMERNGK